MASPSLAPTGVSVIPTSGGAIEVRATFHQANALPATYCRFQVSVNENFGTTEYDSNQISISSIADGTEGMILFDWQPATEGTYYYRICFWDANNYTDGIYVWNGTNFDTPAIYTLRPNGDSIVQLKIYPTTPTTHYDKVDEVSPNEDADYIYQDVTSFPYDKFSIQDLTADQLKAIVSIDSVKLYIRAKYVVDAANMLYSLGIFYDGSLGGTPTYCAITNSYANYIVTATTNPKTGNPWIKGEINDASFYVRVGAYVNSAGSSTRMTQVWVEINAKIMGWSPPGDNILVVGFPTVTSLTYEQTKEKFTFTAVVSDSYSKPPRTTLTVGNRSYVMNIINRTGAYSYTYSKQIELEEGDYEYHIEVGNVWTVLIGSEYFLHASYKLREKKIDLFLGSEKLNAWDIVLTDNLLPETSTIQFNTDTFIESGDINVVMRTNNFKKYTFIIASMEKDEGFWRITANSKSKEDFDDTVTFGAQIVNSLDLLKTILPDYYFRGDLEQNVVYQQYLNESISNILSKMLILNNKVAYERNKIIQIKDWTERSRLVMHKDDALTGYREDRDQIINSLREYYTKIQYPLPDTALTNYASTLWTGTVADALKTENYLLAPSNSLYILKGTGEIYATVDHLFTEYDTFNLNWSPDTATSLNIRLETDAANYYSCTRTYSGSQGAGFVEADAVSKTSEVTKTIDFTATKIAYVEAFTTQPCKVKMQLKLSGAVVMTAEYRMTDSIQENYRIFNSFANTTADQLVLTFTNLYVISNTYGVNCYKLAITRYVSKLSQIGTKTVVIWKQNFNGTATPSGDRYLYKGESTTITGQVILGAVPSLSGNWYYKFDGNAKIYAGMIANQGDETVFSIFMVNVSLFLGGGNKLIADFSMSFTNSMYYLYSLSNSIFYNITAQLLETQGTFETVWIYEPLPWSETYNLWDNMRIPLSSFTKVGTPTDQINTIRLNAAGVSYYDQLFVKASNPQPLYVDVEDLTSMNKWKKKYNERKLDGWNSQESATAFAEAFVNLFKDPITQYSKSYKIDIDADLGDIVVCDGVDLQIYRIVYDWMAGIATINVGKNVSNTVEFLKSAAKRIETLEKNVM